MEVKEGRKIGGRDGMTQSWREAGRRDGEMEEERGVNRARRMD